MKAIQVKYVPATNTKPSRLKAWIKGGASVTIPYPHELNGGEDAFKSAAQALAYKLDWNFKLVGGGLPNGNWAFCLLPVNQS